MQFRLREVVLGDVGWLLNDALLAFQRFLQRAVRKAQCAEAGSDSVHSFVSSFERCETHVARSDRVNVTLHENFLCTPLTCHTARNSLNSLAPDTGAH